MNNNLNKILNDNGLQKEPFLFVISYDLKNFYVKALKDLSSDIKFEINSNLDFKTQQKTSLEKFPISFNEYKKKFNFLQENIKAGNSYILNLTSQSEIKTKYTLSEIYKKAKAKYKLKFFDDFVCFSPETFIEIKNNKIYTFPMKGTIDASIKNAEEKILNDKKELAEHTMVVDLLRNDLGIVAKKIKVEKFRFVEKIEAGDKKLLQVSSQISGQLDEKWNEKIGDILLSLLPAGSITGCPKKKTIEILNSCENYDRKYYSGIFGVFDGKSLKSSVMIRFIEKEKNGKLFYKSGGGITCDSDIKLEYEELLDKIYLPF